MNLTDFLLARIAEDEAVALAASASNPERTWEAREVDYEGMWVMPAGCDWPRGSGETEQTEHIARHDPARVLAECEAKRSAIKAAWGDHLQIEGEWGMCRGQDALSEVNDYPSVVQWLALPYADHEDYRKEWRP